MSQLRSLAEQKARAAKSPEIDALWPAEARHVLHELRVHQIELEMQNEELRATQEQLEASKMRYFGLYDLAPVGYLTISEAGLIHEANLTAAVVLGVDRRTLPGQHLSRFILRDDHDTYYRHFHGLFKDGQPQNCELRVRKQDNALCWVRLESTVAAGEPDAPVSRVIVSDITERKRAEDDLRKALQQLELVTSNMAAGVAQCSRDLHYLWVNRSLASWLGRAPEEIAGCRILDVIGQEAFETIRPHIETALTGEREEYETRVNYRGLGMRWVHAVYVPTKDQEDKVNGWIAVINDVTAERRAQGKAFASQKLETIGTLAGGIAHDFNNLLGGVLAQADLALENLSAGSSPEPELTCIRDATIRGSEIVRQLMIYAGKESEATGLVDVSQAAREMVQLLRVTTSKHAALETDLDQNLPAIRGAAGQIQQVVMNLVTNASEALGDRDGVIRVTTKSVSLDRGTSIARDIPEGDYLQLEVSDTGCGMSLATQANVFDPFFTTKAGGHGLGLAVVQGIVRTLDGTIHLTSEPGKGTTFQVLLPYASTVSEGPGVVPRAQELGSSFAATVLVVEDEEQLRIAVSRLLRKRGFEILEAADGTSAIDVLRASDRKIDAMLLDMTIPGRSSREVFRVAGEVQPRLRVVLTSAYPEETVRTAVGATQTCRFIRKPFKVAMLLQTLENALFSKAL
jgi:PAS domain S-box-containing protein